MLPICLINNHAVGWLLVGWRLARNFLTLNQYLSRWPELRLINQWVPEFCCGQVVVMAHHEIVHLCDMDNKSELAFDLTVFITNCNSPLIIKLLRTACDVLPSATAFLTNCVNSTILFLLATTSLLKPLNLFTTAAIVTPTPPHSLSH